MFAMMIGAAVALYAVIAAAEVLGVVISAVFSGAAGIMTGNGVVIGAMIGYALYRAYRKNRPEETAECETEGRMYEPAGPGLQNRC